MTIHDMAATRDGADIAYRPEKLMLVLRDGRKLMGVLRSWDQFGMALGYLSKEWS